MSKAGLSESIQDYLKSVYKLQSTDGRVSIGALAKDQSVSPASASAMVKKLTALELLEHEKYRGARLTPSGERVALETGDEFTARVSHGRVDDDETRFGAKGRLLRKNADERQHRDRGEAVHRSDGPGASRT